MKEDRQVPIGPDYLIYNIDGNMLSLVQVKRENGNLVFESRKANYVVVCDSLKLLIYVSVVGEPIFENYYLLQQNELVRFDSKINEVVHVQQNGERVEFNGIFEGDFKIYVTY